MEYRPTRDCERRVETYVGLADDSRASGNGAAAERFLLLAWAAYDDADADLDMDELEDEGAQPLRHLA